MRCHVDACIGGWVLPYAARLGRDLPPWTFAVDGVTSISVDLHKYAYAPKGTSILLHRTPALRRPQYFASAAWPGYTMLNSTMQSTKSGGPLAGAWAVVQSLGDDGYLDLTRTVLEGVDRLVAGIAEIPALRVVVAPDSTLVALETDGSCDVFTLTDAMARGRVVRPAAALLRRARPDPAPVAERRDRAPRAGVPGGAARERSTARSRPDRWRWTPASPTSCAPSTPRR